MLSILSADFPPPPESAQQARHRCTIPQTYIRTHSSLQNPLFSMILCELQLLSLMNKSILTSRLTPNCSFVNTSLNFAAVGTSNDRSYKIMMYEYSDDSSGILRVHHYFPGRSGVFLGQEIHLLLTPFLLQPVSRPCVQCCPTSWDGIFHPTRKCFAAPPSGGQC